MTTAKTLIRQVLNETDEEAPMDEILYRILARQAVEKEIAQAEAGQSISHEEMKGRVAERIANRGGRR